MENNLPPVLSPNWRTMIRRASSLKERLATHVPGQMSQNPDGQVDQRLQEWCQVVAQGDWDMFYRRLEWDGLDLATVRQVLGQTDVDYAQPIPDWCNTLQAVIAQMENDGIAWSDRCFDPTDPLPFETVLLPFIQVARQRLATAAGANYTHLADTAHAALEWGLLTRLSKLAAQSLQLEFSVFRSIHQPDHQPDYASAGMEPARTHYTAFVQHLCNGGWLSFFQEYSVLGRSLAIATDFWVEATQALLARLGSDRPHLQATFGAGKELGQAIAATPDLSDHHRGGQTVIALTFASGVKLIYKPKDIGPEVVYFQFLEWVNQRSGLLPLKALKTIPRPTYGWVEFAEHLPCQDGAAVRRYYQRMGMLLALIYALGGTDCHRENLIACGEHPVLIDLEALLYHRVGNIASETERSPSLPSLWESVLNVGFLPQWEIGVNGTSYDMSALAGSGGQKTSFRTPKWQHVNTDQMGFRVEYGITADQMNLPFLPGATLALIDYQADVIAGFQAMYHVLLQQQSILLGQESPLAAFATQPIRFMFRPTRIYGYINRKLLQPKFMREGIDWSIQIDALSRALLTSAVRHPFWSLLHLEQQSLEQLDIPIFNALANSPTLLLEAGTLGPCFEETAFQRMITRLSLLSEDDLVRQTGFIQASFYAYTAGKPGTVPTISRPTVAVDLQDITPLSTDVLVEQAIAIATKLHQWAIVGQDGSATWAALTYIEKAQCLQLRPSGYGLYDGCCGVALFLAAVTRLTNHNEFRELGLAALQPLQQMLHIPTLRQNLVPAIGLGGASGVGSILYALVHISQLLDDPALLDSAHLAASVITPDVIQGDRDLDVIAGTAGTILGLLALYRVSADPEVLRRAVWCGRHLLDQQQTTQRGDRTWATLNHRFLAGFSHGAAGIAYALLRLYAITGETALREAAEAGMAYERSIFSPQFSNWPDLRGKDDPVPAYLTAWCHGATGIGLARLGGLAILDTPAIRGEIESALKATQLHTLHTVDHLCCGNFGKVELLWEAATRLGQPELAAIARKQTAWVINRAIQAGTFSVFGKLPSDAFTPGFFVGTSGIGYALLRQAFPEQLPAVLLWD